MPEIQTKKRIKAAADLKKRRWADKAILKRRLGAWYRSMSMVEGFLMRRSDIDKIAYGKWVEIWLWISS